MDSKQNKGFFYIFVFSVYLIIYLLSISHNIAISHDSIFYILAVEEGSWDFHPHHLIYHVFKQAVYSVTKILHLGLDAMIVMSALNSLFGALTMVVVVKIFTELFDMNRIQAVASSGIIAFSYGVWYYSACVEVYVIPLFFVVLCYYEFFSKSHKPYLIGIYAGLATLFHQMYIFLFPVIIIAYLFKKVPSCKIVAFSLVYSFIVGTVYILVLIFYFDVSGISDSLYVLTKYAHEHPHHWSSVGISVLINDIIGFGRTVLSIHYLYSFESIQKLLIETFPNNSFNEEIYLVRNMPAILSYILLSMSILLIIAIGRILIASFIKMVKIKKFRLEKIWFLAYVIIFGLFFSFWSSNNPEFWISIYTITMITAFRFVAHSNRERIFTIITALLMMLFNLLSTIHYAKEPANDFFSSQIDKIKSKIETEDVLIYDSSYMIADFLRYNDYKLVIPVETKTSVRHLMDSVELHNTGKNRIFMVESVFNPENQISDKYRRFRDTIIQKYTTEQIAVDSVKFNEIILNVKINKE